LEFVNRSIFFLITIKVYIVLEAILAFTTVTLGEVLLLRYILNNTTPGNPIIHLYKNDRTPTVTDTLSMYTESTASGYTSYALGGSGWTFSTTAGTSYAAYARQTFTYSTSEALYGWYITNTDVGPSTQMVWVERFPGAPFQVPVTGGNISVDPLLGLS
jgi:hypothetical protein